MREVCDTEYFGRLRWFLLSYMNEWEVFFFILIFNIVMLITSVPTKNINLFP